MKSYIECKNDQDYQGTLESAAKKLIELFSKNKKEPTYSLGFKRWAKISQAKRKAMLIKYNKKELSYAQVYNLCINDLEKR